MSRMTNDDERGAPNICALDVNCGPRSHTPSITPVVPKVGCTAPWWRWDYLGGRWRWAPPSVLLAYLRLEVTLDQTLGNWSHFIKPIHRIENLLTVK
jgi:hypothetical protein